MSTVIEGHNIEELRGWDMVLLRRRMLNAIESGMVMPIYRRRGKTKMEGCIRGCFEEYLDDVNGVLVEG